MHLSLSKRVLRGSNAQFQAQLQTPALSCYLKGLNIVEWMSVGFTGQLVKLLSYYVHLLALLLRSKHFMSPMTSLCSACHIAKAHKRSLISSCNSYPYSVRSYRCLVGRYLRARGFVGGELELGSFMRGKSVFFCGIVAILLHAESSGSMWSSGWRGFTSSGHLGNSARKTQGSVAARDGMRPTAPPHSIEFS